MLCLSWSDRSIFEIHFLAVNLLQSMFQFSFISVVITHRRSFQEIKNLKQFQLSSSSN